MTAANRFVSLSFPTVDPSGVLKPRRSGLVLAQQWRVIAKEKNFVYVLRSAVDPERHYVGLTADVAERVAAHNAGQSAHTAGKRPWMLVVSVEFADEQLARRFEHYLKSGSGRAFSKRHFAPAVGCERVVHSGAKMD